MSAEEARAAAEERFPALLPDAERIRITRGELRQRLRGAFQDGTSWQVSREVTDPRDVAHIECDCVPHLGPSHCHLCSKRESREVRWSEAHGSREVTEAEVAEIVDEAIQWSTARVSGAGIRYQYDDLRAMVERAARAALIADREVRP